MTEEKHKCGMMGILGLPENWEILYPKRQNKVIIPLGNDIFLMAKNAQTLQSILKALEA